MGTLSPASQFWLVRQDVPVPIQAKLLAFLSPFPKTDLIEAIRNNNVPQVDLIKQEEAVLPKDNSEIMGRFSELLLEYVGFAAYANFQTNPSLKDSFQRIIDYCDVLYHTYVELNQWRLNFYTELELFRF